MISFKKLCYGAQFKYSAEDADVWVKIGHNTVAGWKAEYVSDSWIGQSICAFAEDDQLDTDVFLVTAAPAEDVRAVGEEPVGYSYRERVWATGLGDYVWREKLEPEAPTEDQNFKDLVPLYRRPQGPVVLPEQCTRRTTDDRDEAYDKGWNACLDAFEALNK